MGKIDRPSAPTTARLLTLSLLAAVAAVPWVVLVGDAVDFVFAFGLVDGRTGHLVTLPRYLSLTAGLPDRLLAWPISVVLYVGAVCGAILSVVEQGDRRVTAGLLVLAGVSNLFFAVGLASTNPAVTPVPTGTVALWTAAWLRFRYDWMGA